MSEQAQAFDQAFRPELKVEILYPGIVNVTDDGVTLLVQDYYCAHCRDNGNGGKAWCEHKEAAFGDDGRDQYETYAAALDVGVQ